MNGQSGMMRNPMGVFFPGNQSGTNSRVVGGEWHSFRGTNRVSVFKVQGGGKHVSQDSSFLAEKVSPSWGIKRGC